MIGDDQLVKIIEIKVEQHSLLAKRKYDLLSSPEISLDDLFYLMTEGEQTLNKISFQSFIHDIGLIPSYKMVSKTFDVMSTAPNSTIKSKRCSLDNLRTFLELGLEGPVGRGRRHSQKTTRIQNVADYS